MVNLQMGKKGKTEVEKLTRQLSLKTKYVFHSTDGAAEEGSFNH